MLTIKTRPYTPAEKELITGELPPGTETYFFRLPFSRNNQKQTLSLLGFIFFILISFALVKNIFAISGSGEVILIITIILVGLLLMWRVNRNKRKPDADHAEIIHVNTRRAIKKENPFSPGMAFYVDVVVANEPKTLFLWGKRLEEMDHDRIFPNTEFIVVRSSLTRQLIDCTMLGNYFPAEKTLPPFTREDLEKDQVMQDVQILDTRFDQVK